MQPYSYTEIIQSENLMQKALQFESTLRRHLNIEGVVEPKRELGLRGTVCLGRSRYLKHCSRKVYLLHNWQPNTLVLAPPACMPEEGIISLKENLNRYWRRFKTSFILRPHEHRLSTHFIDSSTWSRGYRHIGPSCT